MYHFEKVKILAWKVKKVKLLPKEVRKMTYSRKVKEIKKFSMKTQSQSCE